MRASQACRLGIHTIRNRDIVRITTAPKQRFKLMPTISDGFCARILIEANPRALASRRLEAANYIPTIFVCRCRRNARDVLARNGAILLCAGVQPSCSDYWLPRQFWFHRKQARWNQSPVLGPRALQRSFGCRNSAAAESGAINPFSNEVSPAGGAEACSQCRYGMSTVLFLATRSDRSRHHPHRGSVGLIDLAFEQLRQFRMAARATGVSHEFFEVLARSVADRDVVE